MPLEFGPPKGTHTLFRLEPNSPLWPTPTNLTSQLPASLSMIWRLGNLISHLFLIQIRKRRRCIEGRFPNLELRVGDR